VLSRSYKAPTVKQHLAAIRMLFDWLIVGQVVGQNPAAVRGPKHVVKKGKTPVRDGDEARQLLASIDISTVGGLRDRALIALLIYSFARISAAMMVEGPTAAVRAFNPLSGMLRWCIGKGSGGIQRP
jgi:integrase/recombinase XerD